MDCPFNVNTISPGDFVMVKHDGLVWVMSTFEKDFIGNIENKHYPCRVPYENIMYIHAKVEEGHSYDEIKNRPLPYWVGSRYTLYKYGGETEIHEILKVNKKTVTFRCLTDGAIYRRYPQLVANTDSHEFYWILPVGNGWDGYYDRRIADLM